MEMTEQNNRIEILSAPEKVEMADEWYNYASLDHFWIKSRYRAIVSKLNKKNTDSYFFEIGCGHGIVIKQFEDKHNFTVDGCDLNMLALKKIRDIKGNIYCLDITERPKRLLNKYDGILLMDVIEHIENDYEFVLNSIKYSKIDGFIIINVPALNLLSSKYDKSVGHKRRYNKRMMRKLFQECGIEEVSIFYWGITLIPIAIIRKIFLMFVREDKIVSSGFKKPNKFINNALNWILKIENKYIKSPTLGTSLAAIGRIVKNK